MIILKKTFQIIGLVSLICFSFFVTEKTALVISEMDDIMVSIKDNESSFNTPSKDAYINDNTIIPGVSGRSVNIEKSYKRMKSLGYYSEEEFVFDYTLPKVSLEDNKDKYIIKGPSDKRMVSLIFILKENDDIQGILQTLKNYNITSTFFISPLSDNSTLIHNIIKDNHNIGIYIEKNTDISFLDITIKKVNKQGHGFCINKNKIDEVVYMCNEKDNYLISPVYIKDSKILNSVKRNVESGSLLAFNINRELKRELSNIIIYLKGKGYEITNLENHVIE